jgi:hypothetical protein
LAPSTDDPTPRVTLYTLSVVETLVGSLQPGEAIPMYQSGGMRKGIEYRIEGDPVLQVGATYLMFMRKVDPMGWYSAAPYGRFVLDSGGGLAGTEPQWANLFVTRSLSGKSLQDARAAVASAAD